ncbi:putative LRR containing protein [Trachipleistophora hominis]|uniref:Putative LRR containing protein n=1 Tax=Trachipleistophora hominis TaxID=72359 RepID=L7JW58_TRAHO|nr:putative LRR containing protein [Trachipleistophora hominis]
MNVPDLLARWILCFKNETSGNACESLICDNLKETHLSSVVKDIFESKIASGHKFKAEEYDTSDDPLGIFQKDENSCTTSTPQTNEQTSDENGNSCVFESKTQKYMRLDVPVTKSLYMKTTKLSENNDIDLTDSEIVEFMEHLMPFLDDNSLILQLICQKLMNDYQHFEDRIRKVYCDKYSNVKRSRESSSLIFDLHYSDLIRKIQSVIYFYVKDKSGNVALFSETEDMENRLPVYTNLTNIGELFVPHFLKTDKNFLMKNHEHLYLLYRDTLPRNTDLVVKISPTKDFKPDTCSACDNLRNNTVEAVINILKCGFICSNWVKKLIIEFEKTESNLDSNFFGEKDINSQSDSSPMKKNIILPGNLTKVYIRNPPNNISFDIPDTLKVFVLRKNEFTTGCRINVL